MNFPGSKFYFKRTPKKDLLSSSGRSSRRHGSAYAEGKRAYEMANMVLDVAQQFSCRRVFHLGRGHCRTHHTMHPKVWAVANEKAMLRNSAAMIIRFDERSGRERKPGQHHRLERPVNRRREKTWDGRDLPDGEIPDYLSRMPFPYPKASKAVLGTLARMMGLNIATIPWKI